MAPASPLGEWLALIDAGFVIERVAERRPSDDISFLHVRVRKFP